jgi:hypothetical protein
VLASDARLEAAARRAAVDPIKPGQDSGAGPGRGSPWAACSRRAMGDHRRRSVQRGRSQAESTGPWRLEDDPRQRPTAATVHPGGTPMMRLSLKARQKPPNRDVTVSEIGATGMAAIVTTDKILTICPDRESRIAWQPIRVIKPGPCRLRNFASGLSALALLHTGFHICSALSQRRLQMDARRSDGSEGPRCADC